MAAITGAIAAASTAANVAGSIFGQSASYLRRDTVRSEHYAILKQMRAYEASGQCPDWLLPELQRRIAYHTEIVNTVGAKDIHLERIKGDIVYLQAAIANPPADMVPVSTGKPVVPLPGDTAQAGMVPDPGSGKVLMLAIGVGFLVLVMVKR